MKGRIRDDGRIYAFASSGANRDCIYGWSYHYSIFTDDAVNYADGKYVNTGKPMVTDISKIKSLGMDCVVECIQAMEKFPSFNSAHEGYAVLLEEVDELWDHVKTNQKRRDIEAMKKECIQVAAMAMRFALELCNEVDGRR